MGRPTRLSVLSKTATIVSISHTSIYVKSKTKRQNGLESTAPTIPHPRGPCTFWILLFVESVVRGRSTWIAVGSLTSRKKEINPPQGAREGWEDGTPPPHRDFKERSVVLGPNASPTPNSNK